MGLIHQLQKARRKSCLILWFQCHVGPFIYVILDKDCWVEFEHSSAEVDDDATTTYKKFEKLIQDARRPLIGNADFTCIYLMCDSKYKLTSEQHTR